MRTRTRQLLRSFNLDVRRFNPVDHADLRRARIIREEAIDVVLDIGANTGQYGRSLRDTGFTGRIVSFEPQSAAYADLAACAADDPLWEAHHCALGSADGEAEINIAANSVSSSLLPMEEAHVRAAPQSAYIGTERVAVRRLDRAFIGLADKDRVFMKIDVQGFEHEVLAGAADIMDWVTGIEIELSLVPLYSGHLSFRQTVDLLDDRGYRLVSIERGFTDDHTGHILQVDGIFVRQS